MDVIEAVPVEPLTLKGFHRPMPAVDVLRLKAPRRIVQEESHFSGVRGRRRTALRRYNRPGWTRWAWSESPVSLASS